MLLVTYCIK